MHHWNQTARLVLTLMLAGFSAWFGGCHSLHDCPILQPLTGGNIPAPLPPEGETYDVLGRRDGIRFYIVKYSENLYRGGDIRSEKGAQALKDLGIRTVVSVTPNDTERSLARQFGFELVEIPFGFYNLTKAELDRFLAAVDSRPGPIYVHDFGGIAQAGILLAHYRIHRQGWTFDKALAEYRRLGANYWDSLAMVDTLKKNAPP